MRNVIRNWVRPTKSEIAQNERLVAVLKIESDEAAGRVLLVDRLPAGLEIENPRLVDSGDAQFPQSAHHRFWSALDALHDHAAHASAPLLAHSWRISRQTAN